MKIPIPSSMISAFVRTGHGSPTAAVFLVFALAACAPQQFLKKPNQAALKQKLVAGGKFSEDSFYACLLNGLAQGLPIRNASDDCATKLLDEPQGGGVGGIPGPIGGRDPFDPGSVQANCGAGNPQHAQTYSGDPVGYGASSIKGYEWTKVGGWEGYGYGTYGGRGEKDEEGNPYLGLSEEESKGRKQEAIDKADKVLEEYQALREQTEKEKDPAKKQELEAKTKAKEKEWEEAHKEASKDPNKVGKGFVRTGPVSLCEQTLQAAREILYECNRTGWKGAQCGSLAARMNHCPDPTYIYVDPEAGYSCGEKIDPKAVKDAWSARCAEIVKYGPGGANPCQAPVVIGDGRFVEGNSKDICGDPRAFVDPDDGACVVTLEAQAPFDRPTVQQLIVWALDRLGGPIVVLPRTPKPLPKPGPDPRPAPR